MPIKAGWRDAFLALWYFSRNNKHYIQLSTTTSLASLLQCPHFRSSRPDLFFEKGVLKNFAKFIGFLWQRIFLWISWHFKKHFFRRTPPVTASGICTNKSAAEAWICLVSFYGGVKDFISTYKCFDTVFSVFFRSNHQTCSVKKVFLRILQNSQENNCARFSLLKKLLVSGLQLY